MGAHFALLFGPQWTRNPRSTWRPGCGCRAECGLPRYLGNGDAPREFMVDALFRMVISSARAEVRELLRGCIEEELPLARRLNRDRVETYLSRMDEAVARLVVLRKRFAYEEFQADADTGQRAPPCSDDRGCRVRAPPQPGPGLGFKQGMAAGCRNGSRTLHQPGRDGASLPQPVGPLQSTTKAFERPRLPGPAGGSVQVNPRSAISSLAPSTPVRGSPFPAVTFAPRSRTLVGGLLLTPLAAPPRPVARAHAATACRAHGHASRHPGASPPVSPRLRTKVWAALYCRLCTGGPWLPCRHTTLKNPGRCSEFRNAAEQQPPRLPRGRSPGPAPPQQVPEPASRFLAPHDSAIPLPFLPCPLRRC